ncbi:MAG: hypothetical protein ACRC53_00260 [Plesiomonas sp.]|uniref:hypothetical protein n=1 Tax=Plesiomonas sp. TaxID=2486279 RepID=UPI003F3C8BBA
MKQSMNEKYKKAYLDGSRQLPIELLRNLHCVDMETIQAWIDEKSVEHPDFSAIYELYMLMNRLDIPVPRSLLRLILKSISRVTDAIDKLSVNPVTNEQISKQKRIRVRKSIYFYKGEPVFLREIESKLNLNISRQTILARIREAGITTGNSIDNIDFSKRKNCGRKRKLSE